MLIIDKNFYFTIISLFSFLFFSFFLNFSSSIYSDVDLFGLDLAERGKTLNGRKLLFVLKNNYLFFAVVCFLQVIINFFVSFVIVDNVNDDFVKRLWVGRNFLILFFSILVALFTEVFARYLASKESGKKLVFNSFFINFSYSIIRPFFFLRRLFRPKRRMFSKSEKEVIRFINNLAVEKVLEKREAKLVQSALFFDELTVGSAIIPWKRIIFLNEGLAFEEVQAICSENLFTRYPVLNKKKEVIGVFSLSIFNWLLLKKEKNKDISWKEAINRDFLFFSFSDNLDKVLEKMQVSGYSFAIVKKDKKNIGIVTFKRILTFLIGEIKDERDLLFPRFSD